MPLLDLGVLGVLGCSCNGLGSLGVVLAGIQAILGRLWDDPVWFWTGPKVVLHFKQK